MNITRNGKKSFLFRDADKAARVSVLQNVFRHKSVRSQGGLLAAHIYQAGIAVERTKIIVKAKASLTRPTNHPMHIH